MGKTTASSTHDALAAGGHDKLITEKESGGAAGAGRKTHPRRDRVDAA